MTPLTARERQVLGCICKGWKTKEIARHLKISTRTVEDHRTHILKKYKARNLVELMLTVYDIPDEAVA
jgi:DNA-binding NarL/FixJ family response regulator